MDRAKKVTSYFNCLPCDLWLDLKWLHPKQENGYIQQCINNTNKLTLMNKLYHICYHI